MLITPPEHRPQTAAPRRLGAREKWIVGAVIGLVGVIAVLVVISFASPQRKSANGCIDVSAATVIGGSELYRCGAAARDLCSSPSSSGAQTTNVSFARAMSEACRKAGLPVPPAP